jgi:hypothetical protein
MYTHIKQQQNFLIPWKSQIIMCLRQVRVTKSGRAGHSKQRVIQQSVLKDTDKVKTKIKHSLAVFVQSKLIHKCANHNTV